MRTVCIAAMASAGTFAVEESGDQASGASARLEGRGGAATLHVEGDWVVINAMELDKALDARSPRAGRVTFDLSGLGRFDTTGAWLLDRTKGQFEAAGASVEITGGEEAAMSLFEAVRKAEPKPEKRSRQRASAFVTMLARAGRAVRASCPARAKPSASPAWWFLSSPARRSSPSACASPRSCITWRRSASMPCRSSC